MSASLATIAGILNIIQGNFSGQTIIFIPLGIFIWGDALILGPFLIITSIFLLRKNNSHLSGLVLSIYYSIRIFIEILYGLNAQFSHIKRPWEEYWIESAWLSNFATQELHVLYQLVFTCLFVLSAFSLIYFVKEYLKQS